MAAAPCVALKGEAHLTAKLKTDKLLFPKELTKDTNPQDFTLWKSAFQRFHASCKLELQDVPTQQTYLLQFLDMEIRRMVEPKMEVAMPIFGLGGCMSVIDEAFRRMYPVFQRWVEFFRKHQVEGEDPADYLHRLTSLGREVDVDQLDLETMIVFNYVSSLIDERLRDKLFDLKWKDLTTVKEVLYQHSMQT